MESWVVSNEEGCDKCQYPRLGKLETEAHTKVEAGPQTFKMNHKGLCPKWKDEFKKKKKKMPAEAV